jgi:multiphosphoryl transfer protein
VVGIVVVSHSASLAEGVVEVAREMGGPDVAMQAAGGLNLPDRPLGTDAAMVLQAIEEAYSDDGVLVLMDLGSAVLSAEMALDMLAPERRQHVLLCEAPLVEGAVAAAVAARLGSPLEEVAGEARGGLQSKVAHLGPSPEQQQTAGDPGEVGIAASAGSRSIRFVVEPPLGLHARPAARLVQTAGRFDAEIEVSNLTAPRGPATARSLNALATLGVRHGHEVLVAARGREADEALAAIEDLARRNFDDPASPAPPMPSPSDRAIHPPPDGSLSGLAASPGIALGPARHLRVPMPDVPTVPAADPRAEWEALQAALRRVHGEIEETRAFAAARLGEDHAAIFDAHLLFLEDEALVGPARRAILEEGRNAAQAWDSATQEVAASYRALDDEYMRLRADDLTGVARRVVAHLSGQGSARPSLDGAGIVIAADLFPADAAALDSALAKGIATAYGGPTSHAAILARSLGIPAAMGLGEAVLAVPEGVQVILDGEEGVLCVDPSADLAREYARRRDGLLQAERAARAAAAEPAVTRDGHRIEVVANIGSPNDVPKAVAAGAEGVGLLRTEFLFMDRESLPDEEEQYGAYRGIAEALAGRPLIIRTLDVGADKPLGYLPQGPEANPFLGVRGIRLALARPDVLVTQLRAVLRVAAEHPVKVMFPMVTTLGEFRAATELLEEARRGLAAGRHRVPPRIEVGVMVEVPAVALMADRFAPHADFFSIGTNDLSQYTMAADRGNERVAGLADPLHPGVLQLIRRVARAAEQHGKWAGVCGEMAADPVAVPFLIGLGITELSVSSPSVPAVKELIRRLDRSVTRALSEKAMGLSSAADVRALPADPTGQAGDPIGATTSGS